MGRYQPVASRGSPAPGGQCLHRCPPPRISAPPLVKPNPLALGQKSTSKKKKSLQPEREKKDTLMHRERGALDSAAFKISPYKLGGRPLQGLRPGAMAPPAPLGTPLLSTLPFVWILLQGSPPGCYKSTVTPWTPTVMDMVKPPTCRRPFRF